MRSTRGFRVFLVMVGLLVMLGLAFLSVPDPVGATTDDHMITGKVKEALSGDAMLSKRGIEVIAFRGRVVLRGYVDRQRDADKAIEMAKNIEGVKSVQDNLVIWQEGFPKELAPQYDFQSP